MGLIVDTNVFIQFEKAGSAIDSSRWEPSDTVHISAVTVSELLVGVHRANTEQRRLARSSFVETIISAINVLDFTTSVARIHAHLFAELTKKGKDDRGSRPDHRCNGTPLRTHGLDGQGLGILSCAWIARRHIPFVRIEAPSFLVAQ